MHTHLTVLGTHIRARLQYCVVGRVIVARLKHLPQPHQPMSTSEVQVNRWCVRHLCIQSLATGMLAAVRSTHTGAATIRRLQSTIIDSTIM